MIAADLKILVRRVCVSVFFPDASSSFTDKSSVHILAHFCGLFFSDTGFKMRSFPNVQTYLGRTEALHLLDDPSLDFSFKQPFSTPKQKKTPVRKVKAPKLPKTPKVQTVSAPKVSLKLKRKRPADEEGGNSVQPAEEPGSKAAGSSWEVVKAKTVKARKKTVSPSKKDSPQLKLNALINVSVKAKSPQVAKESRFKSGFKSFLHKDFVTKKAEKSESVEDAGDGTKDSEEDKNLASDHVSFVEEEEKKLASDKFSLPEEQEDPYKSGEEEAMTTKTEKVEEDNPIPSPSVASSGYQVESDSESDNSFSHGPHTFVQKTPLSSLSQNTKTSGSLTRRAKFQPQSRKAQMKRSLSPSDSDGSVRKRSKLSRDADMEEDSRSMGMYSDVSMASREEDENQNMATKVQKMHLSDSSSTKDVKDSASTSSNGSSLLCHTPPPTLLSKGSKTAGARSSSAGPPAKVRSAPKSQRSSGNLASSSSSQESK